MAANNIKPEDLHAANTAAFTFYDNNKKLVGYKYLDLDFVKANKDCSNCDHYNNYCCFDCERGQVKDKYPTSKYTDDCDWVIPK